MLLIPTQGYHVLIVLAAIVGFSYEGFQTVLWTLVFNSLSVGDATDSIGIFGFFWGLATVVLPIFENVILGRIGGGKPESSLFPTIFRFGMSTNSTNDSNGRSKTSIASTTWSPTDLCDTARTIPRSTGNMVVMSMLCGLLLLAHVIQFAMYFHVLRTTLGNNTSSTSNTSRSRRGSFVDKTIHDAVAKPVAESKQKPAAY